MDPDYPHDSSAVQKWEQAKAAGVPIHEHILNVVKAGLSAAPFAGAIASLMSDYIPESRAKRLEQFAENIAQDLTRLKDKVDTDFISSDEFAFLFEQSFKAAAEHHQSEKLEAFRAILVNSAIDQTLSAEVKEYYLSLAQRLTVLHLRILRFMHSPHEYLAAVGISETKIQGGFGQFFPVVFPDVATQVIVSAFADLYANRLINTDQSVFGTMTSGQGLALLGNRVTELGQSFMKFCAVR